MDSYGGIQSCVRSLHDAFLQDGCSVLTYGLPWHDPDHAGPPDDSPRLPASGFPAALDDLITNHEIQGILSHNLLGCYTPGIASAVAACATTRHLPHVILVHDVRTVDPRLPHFDARIDHIRSKILKGAYVAVTSHFNFKAFAREFREPDEIVPPGIDFEVFTPGHEPDAATIAFPGRLTRYKGALKAIEVLGDLSQELGPIRLLLSNPNRGCVGESASYLSEVSGAAARYPKLTTSFLAATESVADIYRRSALTLTLSEYEGFGLVPLESLACNCPVVARPVGGMEWLRGVPGAFCIDDAEQTYGALRQVLSQWKAWRSDACQGRDQLRQTYDIRATARRYLSMFHPKESGGTIAPCA